MGSLEIIEARPIMLGIDLEKPFPLGFGTLSHLPRVLYHLKAIDASGKLEGIGEASIDFPFVNYDAWDVYSALSNLPLNNRLTSREEILNSQEIRNELLLKFPAAYAALNMAVDDLWGKHDKVSLISYYGQKRKTGKALSSIGYQEEASLMVEEVNKRINMGYIPKPKVGKSLEDDLKVIQSIDATGLPYVLDFNATYQPNDFIKLIQNLIDKNVKFENLVFFEQPTCAEAGVAGLTHARHALINLGINTPIVADESFITLNDAIECGRNGIGLNFKLQKVGGITYAREIEMAIIEAGISLQRQSTLGGTFPTAIGRTYDQQGASILESTDLPSDAWEPSTNWFSGDKHLINHKFPRNSNGDFHPIIGFGLGIKPSWEKINKLIVERPDLEYRNIRNGLPGEKIAITLRGALKYAEVYETKSGNNPNWNL